MVNEMYAPEPKNLRKLLIKNNHDLMFINTDEIIMISRSERKTNIYLTGGAVIHTTEALDALEKRLKRDSFFRTHKGYIVNLKMIVSASPWGKATYEIALSNIRETALATAEKLKELKLLFDKDIEK